MPGTPFSGFLRAVQSLTTLYHSIAVLCSSCCPSPIYVIFRFDPNFLRCHRYIRQLGSDKIPSELVYAVE
jgi:hypothetical protein